jgi:hypothetical protein
MGNGDTLTALTVLLLDDVLLSVDTFLDCDARDTVAGRIVLELSSETFPADNFGGDNFRGEEGVFFGDKGGRGGIGGEDVTCGDLKVNPPSKSLSQSSSSVVGGVTRLTI